MCYFFFFQAEDGIRDKLVTGVQTCALPISMASFLRQSVCTPRPSMNSSSGWRLPRSCGGWGRRDLEGNRPRGKVFLVYSFLRAGAGSLFNFFSLNRRPFFAL